MAQQPVDDSEADAVLRVVGQRSQRLDATRLGEVAKRVGERLEDARLVLAREQVEEQDDTLLSERTVRVAAGSAQSPEDLDA
jgi:hypothetical protein